MSEKRSFTLLEALVAITVILTGLMSVMSLVRLSISTASVFQDRIVASNLAQEGIELVRNKEASNGKLYPEHTNPLLRCDPFDLTNPCDPSPRGLSETDDGASGGPCVSPQGCMVDWKDPTDATGKVLDKKLVFTRCPVSGCDPLYFNTTNGLYSYEDAAEKTRYVRKITVDLEDARSSAGGFGETRVVSTILWQSRFGAAQSLTVSTYLSLRY